MPELTIGRDCLALYKTHPAIVLRVGEKLEILLEDGKTKVLRGVTTLREVATHAKVEGVVLEE